jgi:hypothetical protein
MRLSRPTLQASLNFLWKDCEKIRLRAFTTSASAEMKRTEPAYLRVLTSSLQRGLSESRTLLAPDDHLVHGEDGVT